MDNRRGRVKDMERNRGSGGRERGKAERGCKMG